MSPAAGEPGSADGEMRIGPATSRSLLGEVVPTPRLPEAYIFTALTFPPEVMFPAAEIEVPADTAPVAEIVPVTLRAFDAEVLPIPTFEPLMKIGELAIELVELNCGT